MSAALLVYASLWLARAPVAMSWAAALRAAARAAALKTMRPFGRIERAL